MQPKIIDKDGLMSIEKLDFQKVTKEQWSFTLVLNSVIQNIRNHEALGIWVFLYSLPPDWEVIKEQLKNKFHLGNKKIKTIFSYLNRSNLLQYEQERNDDGTMGKAVIHILCGDKFDQNVDFIDVSSGGSESDPAVSSTGGSKNHPAVDRPTGSGLLQKKHTYKRKKRATKENKSFFVHDQKSINSKKHEFAESMDQMASEKRHIEKNEEFKKTRMPDNLKNMFRTKE